MAQFLRLDYQTDLICAGGQADAEVLCTDMKLVQSIEGDDRLDFGIEPGTDAAALIVTGSVVRTVFAGGTEDEEYIVMDVTKTFDESGGLSIRASASPCIPVILSRAGTLVTYGTGGVPLYDDGRSQLTVEEYLDDVLLPFLSARGYSFIAKGVISVTALADYAWTSANAHAWWKGLLALPAINAESRSRRNGNTNYLLDVASQINIGASQPQFRTRKNLRSHSSREDATPLGNAILVHGEPLNGVPAGIEEMTATINDITGGVVTFDGNVVPADDAFDGFYLVAENGTFDSEEILSSFAGPSQVVLASTTGFAVGDRVMFRKTSGANGQEVTLLTDPASIAAHGYSEPPPFLVPGTYGYRNWFDDPRMENFTGGLCDGWTAVFSGSGGVLATQNTTGTFILLGVNSQKIARDGGAPGTPTAIGARKNFFVHRRSGKSRITILANVYFDSGAADSGTGVLRLSLQTQAGGTLATHESAPNLTDSFYTLALIGYDTDVAATNLYRVLIEYVKADGVATTDFLYIDSVMVAFAETGDIPFVKDSFANDLREFGIARLNELSAPAIEDSITLYDLGAENSEETITIGGLVGLVNTVTGRTANPRVPYYERYFERGIMNAGRSRVTLDTRIAGLTRQIAAAA